MNSRKSTRLLSAVLVLLMAFALAAPALAASTSKVYATTALNVRSGPGTNYSIIGDLKTGQVVDKTGTSGNWTKINYSGKTAYVSSSYVRPYTSSSDDVVVIEDNAPSGSNMVATANVNVRSGPGANYAKLGELSKGEAVVKVGATGSWTIINWKSGTAYVSSSYLAAKSGSGGSTTTGTSMVATANVNVRTGPGTGYSLLGYLVKGERVTRTGTYGNWSIITYNGKSAYVSSAYLTPYTGSGSSGGSSSTADLLYALYNSTPIRTGPSTAYRAFAYLDKGDTVQYLAASGSRWYQVQLGGSIGYVEVADVKFVSSSGSSTTTGGYVYATSSVRVYEEPTTSSYSLGYLYAGETARRLATLSNGWTRIDFDGVTAYVQTSRVSVLTGADAGSMSTINKWVYALGDYTYCYSVPSATREYREGYLDEGERVWAISGNSTWTKIQVPLDDSIYYVLTRDLTSSGSTYFPDNGDYSIGSTVYAKSRYGVATYANTTRTPFRVSGESSDYAEIAYGTRMTVKGQIGSLLLVSWLDDREGISNRKTLTAYVDVSGVTDVRPR